MESENFSSSLALKIFIWVEIIVLGVPALSTGEPNSSTVCRGLGVAKDCTEAIRRADASVSVVPLCSRSRRNIGNERKKWKAIKISSVKSLGENERKKTKTKTNKINKQIPTQPTKLKSQLICTSSKFIN